MAGQLQGGGRTYSEEDVMILMNEAAKKGAAEAVKVRIKNEEDENHDESVINPKIVKQLKDTVAVFTALKELSSNPLQQTIEETVGTMAAGVIQSAFAPRGPPPKRDLLDTILNSQFAYGLGSGIGARGPELIESMGRTFGSDKAGQMIDGMLNKYGAGPGTGPGPSRQLPPSNPNPGPPSSPPQEQKTDKQSEKDLLLSLDPNNPEHISAYAETQGGLPIEVARKMLMIHQDAFIEQMKKEGRNIDQISTVRGSHAEPARPAPQHTNVQPPPEPRTVIYPPAQTPIDSKPTNSEPINSKPINSAYNDIQDIDIDNNIHNNIQKNNTEGPLTESEIGQRQDGMQYAEYQELRQQDINTQEIVQENQKMMKEFANDIGKIVGDALGKIENLNNTVFTLQSELNEFKKQKEAIPIPTPSIQIPIQPSRQMPLYDINANLQNTEDFMNELIDENIETQKPPIIIGNKEETEKDTAIEQEIPENIRDKIQEIPDIQEQKTETTIENNTTKNTIEKPDIVADDISKIKVEESKDLNNNLNENVKIEEKENKFAHPINKANIKKIAPSFKKDISEDKNVDKVTDNDKTINNGEITNNKTVDNKEA